MKQKHLILALVSGLLVSGAAQAALESRLGGAAVYDTVLNVTWIANANLAATNTFGLATGVDLGTIPGVNTYGGSYIYTDGTMTWGGAQKWVAAMDAANYLGHSDWALPTSDTCYGYNCTGSQMGELFYTEGGLSYGQSITESAALTSKFSNLQNYVYWSGSEYAPNPNGAWGFYTVVGLQGAGYKSYNDYALAVRAGDVAAVPEADDWAMLLAGVGLVGVAVRRRRG